MSVEQIARLIGDLGFPIAVALYLLVFDAKLHRETNECIGKLTAEIMLLNTMLAIALHLEVPPRFHREEKNHG